VLPNATRGGGGWKRQKNVPYGLKSPSGVRWKFLEFKALLDPLGRNYRVSSNPWTVTRNSWSYGKDEPEHKWCKRTTGRTLGSDDVAQKRIGTNETRGLKQRSNLIKFFWTCLCLCLLHFTIAMLFKPYKIQNTEQLHKKYLLIEGKKII